MQQRWPILYLQTDFSIKIVDSGEIQPIYCLYALQFTVLYHS